MFDLISDIHLDFYVDIRKPEHKMINMISKFVDCIMPEKHNDTLVIAGDVGHYNHQNILLLKEFRERYSNIVFVGGNHDLYFVSNNMKGKYRNKSLNRIREMQELSRQISSTYYLDGNTVEIDGIIFGGCMGWYDFSYAEKVLGKTQRQAREYWIKISNDSRLIAGQARDVEWMHQEEMNKLERIIRKSDVIITHVGGEWSQCNPIYHDDISTSFYYFNSESFHKRLKGKVWCFGHDHHRRDYEKYGCRFVNNALGYPEENKGARISNIEIR